MLPNVWFHLYNNLKVKFAAKCFKFIVNRKRKVACGHKQAGGSTMMTTDMFVLSIFCDSVLRF